MDTRQMNNQQTTETSVANAGIESRLIQRGRRLEYLSIAWTCVEAVVAFICGYLAASVSRDFIPPPNCLAPSVSGLNLST